MKKVAVFLLYFFISLLLYSQENESFLDNKNTASVSSSESKNSEIEVNKQYETFRWNPVAKSSKYLLTIEKLQDDKKTWKAYKNISTKKTSLEILMESGNYRVCVSTYNFLGRKSATTEWAEFRILEEHVPYLYDNYYKIVPKYKTQVLFINNSQVDISKIQDSDCFISAEKGFPKNSFFVKGRNIYSPKTEFSLIPTDKSEKKGIEYKSYNENRKTVPLEVLHRDSKKGGVIVSYDEKLLASGYYYLQAKNPGDNIDKITILVIADERITISPAEGFNQDDRYEIPAIAINPNDTVSFSVTGTGFSQETMFYLEKTDGKYSYPFDFDREEFTVLVNINELHENKANLSCSTYDLESGYYNLVAKSYNGDSAHFAFLVEENFNKNSKISIRKVKSKYNKKSKLVDFTFYGDNLNKILSYYLVSEYIPEIEKNNCVKIENNKDGKWKFTYSVDPKMLDFKKYALVFEDENKVYYETLSINDRLKSKLIEVSDDKFAQLFYRPVPSKTSDDKKIGEEKNIQQIVYDNFYYEVNKTHYNLFPYLRLTASSLPKNIDEGLLNLDLRAELDLVNYDSFYLTSAIKYNPNKTALGNTPEIGLEFNSKFALNWTYFQPYVSIGIGYDFIDSFANYKMTDNQFEFCNPLSFLGDPAKHDLYVPFQLGTVLFQFFDFRYNLELHDLLGSKYFTDSFSIGIRLPIRPDHFERKTIPLEAKFYKEGVLSKKDLKNVEGGLEKLILVNGVEVIKSKTFEKRFDIKELTLPESIKVIEKDAFKDWTNGQTIILDWLSSSNEERDLSGLKNCNANIIYQNGEHFSKPKNPFLSESESYKVNDYVCKLESRYVNDRYHLGTSMTGSFYKGPVYAFLQDRRSSNELLDYVKSGNKLTFKALVNSSSSYEIVMFTEENKVFSKSFYLEASKVNDVTIDYNDLINAIDERLKRNEKININEVKLVTFHVVTSNLNRGNSDVFFYDFEVKK